MILGPDELRLTESGSEDDYSQRAISAGLLAKPQPDAMVLQTPVWARVVHP